ncbi:MAG: electron transfer flavoprotein subunit alpha/FixB family protein [Burkholderiales bacterium]
MARSGETLLVLAEWQEANVSVLTLELLGLARSLADAIDARVFAALIGGDSGGADVLIRHGADEVFLCSDAPAEYEGERWVAEVERLARHAQARCILTGHTSAGADLAPRLAIRLNSAVAMGCVSVALADGRLLFTRPCYGGNVRETVSIRSMPALATVRAGVGSVRPDDRRKGIVHSMAAGPVRSRTRVVAREHESAVGTRLEDARAIVAGGRGLEGPEGFRVLQALAEVLGAAVGASRVPCDLGWCPHSWQIGLTGKTVTPDLYVAVGISGAGHHMAGCGNAKTIVAINTDPEAAIFKEARFGVVGDYRRIVPALTAAVAELNKESQ